MMNAEEVIAALRSYDVELGQILARFTRTRDAINIDTKDNYRLRTVVTEIKDLLRDHVPGSSGHMRMLVGSYNTGIENFSMSSSYASVEEIRGVVTAVITRIERNPKLFEASVATVSMAEGTTRLLDALDQIVLRFHAVAVQLRDRHANRSTLEVEDEYDVQDLLHALLRLTFDDVRPEEWVPSYAGAASRTDFLLPQIDTFIEAKKTRQGLNAKAIGEQLIVDIARYKKHPQCRRLICFVYDPEGRIANPTGLENDINTGDHGIEVRVAILPKAT